MSRDQQRLADYLAHIVEAIKRIERYTKDLAEREFLSNQLVQGAVIRNFEIIGEASNNIQKHFPRVRSGTPRTAAELCRPDAQRGCSRLLQGGLWNRLENDSQRPSRPECAGSNDAGHDATH